MCSIVQMEKPHAVCVPYPAQGHINPMLKVAKLLHSRGFHVTFVNTEYNHRRLLRSRGPNALDGLPAFRFASIPDGMPHSDADVTQDIPSICEATARTCSGPFKKLISELNETGPQVTCIVSDGCMSFTLDAAEEYRIPEVLFWTPSACGFLCYTQFKYVVEKGLTPLKDESDLTNGYLDTKVDWIPGMKNISLKDLPSFIRTTGGDPNELMVKFVIRETERSTRATAIIVNSFDAFEHDVLKALSSILPPVYAIGPLNLMMEHISDDKNLKSIETNLWKEDKECMEWLDKKETNSVVYVNFGSITVMTTEQLVEFAWGLANSKKEFLWIIRPDLVSGDSAMLPPEFVTETSGRGKLASWCCQEQILKHPAIGGFLTHCGWNSIVESISGGVPMVCWPFFAEQQTNCWYICNEWEIGLEIDSDVKREKVEGQVRELMDGEKGKDMKKKAMEWKKKAQEAVSPGGSSYLALEKVFSEVLISKDLSDKIFLKALEIFQS